MFELLKVDCFAGDGIYGRKPLYEAEWIKKKTIRIILIFILMSIGTVWLVVVGLIAILFNKIGDFYERMVCRKKV